MKQLMSIDATQLTGHGTALTLTLQADNVPTFEEWQLLLKRLMQWLMLQPGVTRAHYVVEFTKRNVPHLHMAVYSDRLPSHVLGPLVVSWWTGHTRGTKPWAQTYKPIDGAVGWLQYLSKHALRGVNHYQRQGTPGGWAKTGRLYAFRGSWPMDDPLRLELTAEQFHKVRRMIASYALSEARQRALNTNSPADWRSVATLRRMRKVNDRSLSEVRGISQWVPEDVLLRMAVASGWEGAMSDDE